MAYAQPYDDQYRGPRARARSPYQSAVVNTLSGGYQPDAGDTPEPVAGDSQTYQPRNNTGVSGYAPGGQPAPALEQSGPQFTGSNYQEYIMGLLGGGNTNEQTLRGLTDKLRAIGVENQIASDGTARGRIHIPGIGPVTLIGDRQTWGDGGWAWRTGNEQYGSGGGGGGATGVAGGGGGAGAANPELHSAFVAALMRLLNPAQATLADPDLASQSNANRIAQQRSYERRRAAGAERLAAGGQMGGALDAGIDTALAARGDAEGAFDADLLARKNDQNRQSQLAALPSVLSLFGLNQNESQFGRDIALRKALAEAGLNQQAILSLLAGL